jgi:hypothetical protein|nr:MAG TPA: hypothetical protein [Caudoviricetes sp.]
MKNENLKMYISYDEPFNGKAFTSNQMHEVYRDLVDKTEYQDFESWLYDMIKSGVFRIVTKTSNCFETEKRMIQLINDLNVANHETLAVEEFLVNLMYRTCLLESDVIELMIEFIYHGSLSLNKYNL